MPFEKIFRSIQEYVQTPEAKNDPFIATEIIRRMGASMGQDSRASAISAFVGDLERAAIEFSFIPFSTDGSGPSYRGAGRYRVTFIRNGGLHRQIQFQRD